MRIIDQNMGNIHKLCEPDKPEKLTYHLLTQVSTIIWLISGTSPARPDLFSPSAKKPSAYTQPKGVREHH